MKGSGRIKGMFVAGGFECWLDDQDHATVGPLVEGVMTEKEIRAAVEKEITKVSEHLWLMRKWLTERKGTCLCEGFDHRGPCKFWRQPL